MKLFKWLLDKIKTLIALISATLVSVIGITLLFILFVMTGFSPVGREAYMNVVLTSRSVLIQLTKRLFGREV